MSSISAVRGVISSAAACSWQATISSSAAAASTLVALSLSSCAINSNKSDIQFGIFKSVGNRFFGSSVAASAAAAVTASKTTGGTSGPYRLRVAGFAIPKAMKNINKEAALIIPTYDENHQTNKYDKFFEDSDALSAGEDSYFILPEGKQLSAAPSLDANSSVMAVFDGVGGWASSGVDPADMSRELMRQCRKLGPLAHTQYGDNPILLLKNGYENLLKDGSVKAGSTTACVLLLTAQGKVSAANLGDSGFIVLRRTSFDASQQEQSSNPQQQQIPKLYECVYRTKEQQHFFNAPYQIGVIPEDRKDGAISNQPEDADYIKDLPVQEGDIIVIGTDGIFDNLFEEQIAMIASIVETKLPAQRRNEYLLNYLARQICLSARAVGQTDERIISPFGKSAAQAGYSLMYGGKLDDCTAIVARVEKND